MTRSNSRQTRRGGGCNIVPRGYTGPWHYQGDAKCKGDPPSNNNNNNGRGSAMAYQVKAYSTNGGRKTRRGSRRSGGGCNIAPKNYRGPWHRQGELKCKGDPPSNNNNNNGRGSAMAYQMKAYSTNGGRKSRRGSRRGSRRATRGGACGSWKP